MYSYRKVLEDDIFQIMEWRNQQRNVLRQEHIITHKQQREYFEKYVFPEYQKTEPKQILFSILEDDKLIGYGGLVHISWINKRAEISFLMETKRSKKKELYKRDFSNFLKFIKKYAFYEKKLNRVFTETYAFRDFHISILEENGFKLEGEMREHIYIDGKFHNSLLHSCLRREYVLEK
jgi:RimJ/RimL family protein N-acetyltransferase